MEKSNNSISSNCPSLSAIAFDNSTSPNFHYSIHENSVLYKNKKKKLMNSQKETQPSPFIDCIKPSKKSFSLLGKISSLFCCYIPSTKVQDKNLQKTILKSKDLPVTQNKQKIIERQIKTSFSKSEIPDLSEEKISTSELNLMCSKKVISTPRSMNYKIVQSKFPFLRKNYIATKLGQYPENSLFFLNNNEKFVLAKIKFIDFYSEDVSFKECEENKHKTPNKFSMSILQSRNPIVFQEHPSSSLNILKSNKLNNKKYSINSLTEEKKLEKTQKFMTYDERLRYSKSKNHNILKNFNNFEKKAKIDTESWEFMIPERISSHIAKRCHAYSLNIILDAYCGIGMNAIQLKKDDLQVIALDTRKIELTNKIEHAVDYANYNAILHGLKEGVNFVKGEFLNMNFNNKIFDVILINPVLKLDPEKRFSLLKNVKFDYHKVLLKSLKLKKNVILCLPKYVETFEIIDLFSAVFNEIEQLEENCLEIEYQFMNKELQQIVVFYGHIAGINKEEILNLLLDMVNKDNKTCMLKQKDFLKSVISKIGIKSASNYIVLAESKRLNDETIIQRFIDLLRVHQELTIEELDEYLKEKNIENKDKAKKEGKYQDLNLREQSLLLNSTNERSDKAKYKINRASSKTSIFELNFENYLEVPNTQILNKSNQEPIQETPNYSYYSGKLISSTDEMNILSVKTPKDFQKDYSFNKNTSIMEISTKIQGQELLKKNVDFFDNHNVYLNNITSNTNKNETKFPEFKCKIVDDFV